jgi:signal transduction histidine kinase
MAAALSHDLNTPTGALKSSIDTLAALASRRPGANEAQLTRISALENQVRRSASEAANRLQEIVKRLQRVTNLDRADIQLVDINALLQDVAYLLESEIRVRQCDLKLEFAEVPPVMCRPQQISAVLTNIFNLLSEMNGQPGKTIRVQTHTRESEIEIVFHGTAPQMRSAETQAIFEPGFSERSGRVVASNWVLFMARQVLRENGGDMRLDKSSPAEPRLILSLAAKRE